MVNASTCKCTDCGSELWLCTLFGIVAGNCARVAGSFSLEHFTKQLGNLRSARIGLEQKKERLECQKLSGALFCVSKGPPGVQSCQFTGLSFLGFRPPILGGAPFGIPLKSTNTRHQLQKRQTHMSQKSTQNHASRIKKAIIQSYLWPGDCPLVTFIYPCFDCGSSMGQNPVITSSEHSNPH